MSRKAWREANKDKKKAYDKAWREANKEKIARQRKAYREANKEKVAEQKKAYYEANKDKEKARTIAWQKVNKDRANVKSANRRALQFRATIRLTELDEFVIDEMYDLAQRRTQQTGFAWEVDHIIPLTKGGLHKPTNLQVVPASWNKAKGNRTEEKYNDYN